MYFVVDEKGIICSSLFYRKLFFSEFCSGQSVYGQTLTLPISL